MIKRILKNASYNSGSQFVMLILSLLIVPFYISRLSVAVYGVYSFIAGFLGYFTVLEIGLGPSITRFTSRFIAKQEYDKINRMITMAMIMQFGVGILVAGVIYITGDTVLQFIIKDEADLLVDVVDACKAIKLASICFVINFVGEVYFATIRGFQRYDISSGLILFQRILTMAVSVILVLCGYGILGIFIGWMIGSAVVFMALHTIVRRIYKGFKVDVHFEWSEVKQIYSFGIYIFGGRISRIGAYAIPLLLIGHKLGPNGIAYYEIANKLFKTIMNFISSGIVVLLPAVSELKSKQEIQKIQSIYLEASKYLCVFCIPFFVSLSLYGWDVLYIWVGRDIADNCWLLMGIFSIAFYFALITIVPANFSLGLGYSKPSAILGVAKLLVIALFLSPFIDNWGIAGAGLNFLLCEVMSIFFVMYVNKRFLGISQYTFWIKNNLVFVFSAVMVFVPLYFLFAKVESILINHIFYLVICVVGINCAAILVYFGFINYVFRIVDVHSLKRNLGL